MKVTFRPFIALAAILSFGLLAVGIGLASSNTTTAAWTDPAEFTTTASAGTWSAPTPGGTVIVSGNDETMLTDTEWEIPETPGNLNFCSTVTVTGTQATPTPWELHADMTKSPFNGLTGTEGIYYSGSTQVTFSNPPGDNQTLVIRGVSNSGNPWNAAWNNALLTDQQTLVITICVSHAPPPATGDASWYQASQSQSGEWTSTRACVRLDVAGLMTDPEANPFYFGWNASVDLSAAKAHLIAAGKTPGYVGWSPDPSGGYQFTTAPAVYDPAADSYDITSGRTTAIRGTQSTSITACLRGY